MSEIKDGGKPENVYELLEAVARHIEEEPRRYYQDMWALFGDNIHAFLGGDFAAPPCGTVCCRAGWIVGLCDGLDAPALGVNRDFAYSFSVMKRAMEILGMSEAEIGALFEPFTDDEDDSEETGQQFVDAPAGTLEYAKAGADGLRAFMEQHAERLKARKLSDIPPARAGL